MPRPARYTVDELLDAAAALLADQGPSAVTMSAVARAVSAPSGSMYHRFPTRAALCGELWIRTEERFQSGVAAALSSQGDPQRRGVAAARFTVQWCREHPHEAQVLLAGADALMLPTTTGHPTIAEVEHDPVAVNAEPSFAVPEAGRVMTGVAFVTVTTSVSVPVPPWPSSAVSVTV